MAAGINNPSTINATKVALGLGAAALGGTLGFAAMAATTNDKGGRDFAKIAAIGGGALAGGIGGYAAWKIFNSTGINSAPVLAGVALLGLGAGAVLGGVFGNFSNPLSGSTAPTPTLPNPPITTPVKPEPGPSASVTSLALATLNQDPTVAANTTAQERVELAAAAVDNDQDGSAVARIFSEIMADEYAGTADGLTSASRTQLAIAALESGRTGAEAATTFANVDSAVAEGGDYATGDIKDINLRADLAAAAVRGAATGEDGAFKYANIANGVPDTTVEQRVSLAVAALEGGVTSQDAVAAFNMVSSDRATSALSMDDRIALTNGALRGNQSASLGIEAYEALRADVDTAKLGDSLLVKIAATVAEKGLTPQDGVLTYVNVAADKYAWNEASDYDQLVQLTVGALEGGRTGAEAATAFSNVSSNKTVWNELDASARFQLAAAALAAGSTGLDAGVAYESIAADSGVNASPQEKVVLTAGSIHGLDADSSSQLLDWYNSAQLT